MGQHFRLFSRILGVHRPDVSSTFSPNCDYKKWLQILLNVPQAAELDLVDDHVTSHVILFPVACLVEVCCKAVMRPYSLDRKPKWVGSLRKRVAWDFFKSLWFNHVLPKVGLSLWLNIEDRKWPWQKSSHCFLWEGFQLFLEKNQPLKLLSSRFFGHSWISPLYLPFTAVKWHLIDLWNLIQDNVARHFEV